MSRRRQMNEGNPANVPAYIVTFSDMVTLLLTFFVMLLSLANMQDPELFNEGRDAFWSSIRCFGLGMLAGRKVTPDFGKIKLKYSISSPDKSFEFRSIDAKEEEIRRIFKKLSQSMTTMPSQIVAKTTNFSVTNIRFSPGDATLNEATKKFLTQFCLDLQQESQQVGTTFKLYVLGLAGDETTEKEQWLLSARRAQAVADFLNSGLPTVAGRQVYSWGAGPGGDWITRDSPASAQSQILIAVLRAND